MSTTGAGAAGTVLEAEPGTAMFLDEASVRALLAELGPSLGLWRAAEVAALREAPCARPILDLGCGDGLVAALAWGRVEIGVDPWEAALARAAARGVYGRLEAAPIEQAAVPAGSVATVVSNSVLEHLPRLDPALAAVRRILRPGGRLVFTAPSEALGPWMALPLRRYADWRNRRLQHLNLWPLPRWRERLAAAGFDLERARPYLPRPLVALWDALDLLEQVRLGRRRLVARVWTRLPPRALGILARAASRLDLSAPPPGGGRLIVARRR